MEEAILKKLKVNQSMLNGCVKGSDRPREVAESNQYHQPPQGFIKLNFDGATKHNPREASIGGVFRDAGGKTLRIFVMDCVEASNKEAELHALKLGLEIALRANFRQL